jgi:hypothetical protein
VLDSFKRGFAAKLPIHSALSLLSMKNLTNIEFDQTQGSPKKYDGAPEFDFWPYADLIPTKDFEGHDCSAGEVHGVYRMTLNMYEHVLISSAKKDVFMVLVNDLELNKVYGHFLLDLNKAYGINET